MTPEIQTFAALAIVVLVAVGFVARAIAKRKQPGCGSDCGAVSPAMRRLQTKLKHRE
jgi:hypothetical protein